MGLAAKRRLSSRIYKSDRREHRSTQYFNLCTATRLACSAKRLPGVMNVSDFNLV